MILFVKSRDQNIKKTKDSNNLQVTLVKTMPTVKEPSDAKTDAGIPDICVSEKVVTS